MFAVSTLFAFVHKNGDSPQETLMEEQIFLLEALDADEACRRCLARCREEEICYLSATNEHVSIEFRQILHVSPLEVTDFNDGTAVFSRYLNPKQAEALKNASKNV